MDHKTLTLSSSSSQINQPFLQIILSTKNTLTDSFPIFSQQHSNITFFQTQNSPMGKQRWKISFQKSSPKQQPLIPTEFICPISNSIMADPVIVSSGHTFERNCILACNSLSYTPILPNENDVVLRSTDFSTLIPNLALKSTILNFCRQNFIDPPKPISQFSAEKIVRGLIPLAELTRSPTRSVSELNRTPSQLSVASQESVTRPLPSSYSSSSSCDIEISSFLQEDELITKLKSSQIFEQEEALVLIRRVTRTREESRPGLCTPRLMSVLKTLISSRYSTLQVNAVAALVNLSLEKRNKVKIVRSGIVPPLIDVLRGGFPESQDHAAGVLFSLSVDDQNKTALGVLGALQPLLHALRSDSERTRNDSALALYHLSLVQSNRVKMIKLGCVSILLGMVRTGHMSGRVLLVLCNLAGSGEGRAALLDGGGVECLVALLGKDEFDCVGTKESCLAALYGLSYGGLRFKGLAKEARAEEVLRRVGETGSERAKEKVERILEVLKEKVEEEEEEIDWEKLLDSEEDGSRTVSGRVGLSP